MEAVALVLGPLLACSVLVWPVLLTGCGGAKKTSSVSKDAPMATTKAGKLKYPNRLFAGSPPTIPHEVDDGDGDGECLDCHAELDESEPAPVVAHANMPNCRQCHVTKVAKGTFVASRFVPRRFGWTGDRLYNGAPPTVPHDIGKLHTDCVACHSGPKARAKVTDHPERVACRQCHVSDVGSD